MTDRFRRGGPGRSFVRGPKRVSTWFQFLPVDTTIASGAATVFFTLNAAALALRPFTVVRTYFIYHVLPGLTSPHVLTCKNRARPTALSGC